MNPEEKSMLQEALELSRENNKILRQMRRISRIGGIVKILYWTLIIGLSFGAYYFIQPYVDAMKEVTGGGAFDTSNSQKILDSLHNFGL